MGYTIKQKIDICLKAESNPNMTQSDLAKWAQIAFNSEKQPSQTTISRILSSKNDIIASKKTDFQLIRRRKKSNPILRQILTEWVTQSVWETIPITTPIIQSTANSIWTRLPMEVKNGNGVFNQKWCNQFVKNLNVNLTGTPDDIRANFDYKLNKIWLLDEKLELKTYLQNLINTYNYGPQDIFTIDEFQLFYSLPLDQIFDMNSIDKGLKQSSSSTENSLTIMLGTNLDGSEKLTPLIVGKNDKFDVSKSSYSNLKNFQYHSNNLEQSNLSNLNLMNKVTETYNIFYKNNINKWITSTMFQNYLLTLEHKLANNSPNRKIIIILDDSSTHRILNLKFSNIKLVYLKNNTNHKSPFNSLYNGVNFDYCPMNFGIVHDFKILYRLQQYLEVINTQQKFHSQNQSLNSNFGINSNSLTNDVLSENDYSVPLVKAIEWIKRAWDSVSLERIVNSWNKTHLIKIKQNWQNNSKLSALILKSETVDLDDGYKKLKNVMSLLNVVLPWEIDELLGLVNERSKATFNYISIDEIVASCLLETKLNPDSKGGNLRQETEDEVNDNWVMSQMLNPSTNEFNDIGLLDDRNFAMNNMRALVPPVMDENPQTGFGATNLDNSLSISALLQAADEMKESTTATPPSMHQLAPLPTEPQTSMLKHKLSQEDLADPNKKRTLYIPSTTPTYQLNDSLPSTASSSPYNGPIPYPKLVSGITYKASSVSNLQHYGKKFSDRDLAKLIVKLLEAAQTDYIHLSKETVHDLNTSLRLIKTKYEKHH